MDYSFWMATTGQIQSVIFLDDDPLLIQVNDEFSFLDKSGELQFDKNKEGNIFSLKTQVSVIADLLHPCFSKRADLETDQPCDMVMWYREC